MPFDMAIDAGVGREQDLLALRFALIERRDSVVWITGPGGSGKTTLLRTFVERYRSFFSGGIVQHSLSGFYPSSLALDGLSDDPGKAALLVIDAVDEAADLSPWPHAVIEAAQRRWPQLQVLLASRVRPAWSEAATVVLGPLPDAMITSIIQRTAGTASPIPAGMTEIAAGNPLLAHLLGRMIEASSIDQAILDLAPFRRTTLVDVVGRPLTRAQSSKLITVGRDASDALLRAVQRDPELMLRMKSREFEAFVARFYRAKGHQVHLTPASGDDGKDMIVTMATDFGPLVIFVECKRFAPDKTVKVRFVRELKGAIDYGKATAGVLITTSHFTRGSLRFQQEFSARLNLIDYAAFSHQLRTLDL